MAPERRLRALIVEDDEADAELVAHALRRAGFDLDWRRVQTAEELVAGLDPDPDVVLVDNSLPGFDASRALEVLRRAGSEVPLIVVSGTLGDEAAVELVRRGAADYVLKDHLARLGEAVGSAIERRRLREETRAQAERLRLIGAQAPGAIWTADADLRCTYAGGRDVVVLGSPVAEEVLGRPVPELLGARVPSDAAWDAHRRELRGESIAFEQTRGERIFRCQLEPLRAEGGRVTGVVGVAGDVTAEHEAVSALREREDRIRGLLAGLVEAQEAERARIAADIHDDTIQVMTAVGMRVEALRRRVSAPEDLDALQKVAETVEASIARLRHLLFELRPRALDEEGLAPALREYLDRLEGTVHGSLDNRLLLEPSLEARTILYRIAQEALVNVRKHAAARRVDVLLEQQGEGTYVRIADDGRGFDPGAPEVTPRGHVGLLSMKERAEMAGGWWRIESAPGAGTTVEFWVPEIQPSR